MINIILTFLVYAKTLIAFTLFTYIYKYFYNSCIEKKVIKLKNEKPKKVIKTRIGLSFVYLVLLSIFYFSLNFYVLFTAILALGLASVTLMHKFDPSLINILKKYDSTPIAKKIWYLYSLIVNLIFKVFSPCHRIIENKINKNKDVIKNNLFGQFANMTFGGSDISLFSNLKTNKKSAQNEINELKTFFKSQSEQIIKSNSESLVNQYNNTENKSNVSDAEEILKSSLPINTNNEFTDNNGDFNKEIQNLKDKLLLSPNNDIMTHDNTCNDNISNNGENEESYIYKMD